MRAILLSCAGDGCSPRAPGRAIGWFTQRGSWPADQGRRPDDPPRQARYAERRWAGDPGECHRGIPDGHALGLGGGLPSASAWLLLPLLAGCGVVGFDDFIKVYTQHNHRTDQPPRWPERRRWRSPGSWATRFFEDERGVRPVSSYISTTHDWGVKLPLVVVLLVIWFIVTATSNGANLTDGADGLAGPRR